MATNPEISAKAGQALGLPPGFKVHTPFPFKGVNLHDAPHAIEDQEFAWIENFVRLGNGSLRTLWDKALLSTRRLRAKRLSIFRFTRWRPTTIARFFCPMVRRCS
jgi:hypothetical protein